MFVKRKFFFSYSGSYGYKLIYVDEQYSRTSGKLISDITSESEYVEHYPKQIFINLLSWLKKIIAILKILLYVAFVKNSKKYKEKQYKERYHVTAKYQSPIHMLSWLICNDDSRLIFEELK